MEKNIEKLAYEIKDELIEIKNNLHMIPELAESEFKTSEYLTKELAKIPGIEILELSTNTTAVVGILKGEKKSIGEVKKTVMLRADMDALPIEENNEDIFKSRHKGVMHACGHDAHMTWVLGTAKLLSKMKNNFSGNIKFVFQPAEETGKGARMLIENKVLENPSVDYVVAAHCAPEYKSSTFIVPYEQAYSAAKGFKIVVKGKGGHGSWPHKCIDPIFISNQIYNYLNIMASRKMNAKDSYVLSIGSIHSGPIDKGNIIPDECVMLGTIRHSSKEGIEYLQEKIIEAAHDICNIESASIDIEFSEGVMPVKNDKECANLAYESILKLFGKENTIMSYDKNLGGEDFYLFTERKKGIYFFIGTTPEEHLGEFGLHSNKFFIDNNVIYKASAALSNIILNLLEK